MSKQVKGTGRHQYIESLKERVKQLEIGEERTHSKYMALSEANGKHLIKISQLNHLIKRSGAMLVRVKWDYDDVEDVNYCVSCHKPADHHGGDCEYDILINDLAAALGGE